MPMHQIKIFYIFVPGLENLSLSSKKIALDFKRQNISNLSNVLHLAGLPFGGERKSLDVVIRAFYCSQQRDI